MTEPTLNYVTCADAAGGHRMAYWQWGDAGSGACGALRAWPVAAGPRLRRAGAGAGRARRRPLRVVCPDVVGRGRSDWLRDPMGYQLPHLCGRHAGAAGAAARRAADRHARLGRHQHGRPDRHGAWRARRSCRCRCRSAGWCSTTSGPAIQWQALQRIGTYLGKTGRFDSRRSRRPTRCGRCPPSFGPHTPRSSGWRLSAARMVDSAKLAAQAAAFTLHYDPAIAVPFRALTTEEPRRRPRPRCGSCTTASAPRRC